METTKIQNYLKAEEKELMLTDWLVRFISVFLIVVFNNYVVSGQKQYKNLPTEALVLRGISLESYSSGSGHGTFFCPSLTFNKGRNAIGIGPTVQKRSMTMNGFKLTYSRNLSCEADKLGNVDFDRLQLNFFSYLQYNDKLPLSYNVVKTEELITREPQINWNEVKLATTEIAAGIELRVNITNTICWKSYVCASAYYHLNYLNGMDHERIAPSLSLGTGINILLPKL